jgi:DNA-directed RNA polymerase specialized sigma24 family protein
LRNKGVEKRNDWWIRSLNVMIKIAGETDPTELAQSINERQLDVRLGRHLRSDETLASLRLDLTDVLATLPSSWQTLLELRKTHTVTEAAREMGVPRQTLNDWMTCIEKRCEEAGLRNYL